MSKKNNRNNKINKINKSDRNKNIAIHLRQFIHFPLHNYQKEMRFHFYLYPAFHILTPNVICLDGVLWLMVCGVFAAYEYKR